LDDDPECPPDVVAGFKAATSRDAKQTVTADPDAGIRQTPSERQ
jgi:hypothetical protein